MAGLSALAILAILGPLVAIGLILLLRSPRWSPYLALVGAVAGLCGALLGLWAKAGDAIPGTLVLPGLPNLPLRLIISPTTSLLSTVVAMVSFLVMLYAVGYMQEEAALPRFFAEMSLFVAAMQLLVLAGDWLLIIVGWELIALASYLLIGFWYERPGVRQAATRAFLTTRAADFGLYIGVFALVSQTQTSEIAPTLEVSGTAATVAGLGFLLAAIGKSAQIPLQGWLQDAMAGPTPVSALLHSATLVAAGPILLLRVYPVLNGSVLIIIGIVGGVTALLTGLTALAQVDLKRMLAASTSSQLGFMLLALGAGSPGAALLHLVFHAAMKSSLFLGAGIFQHKYHSTNFSEIAAKGGGRAYPPVYLCFVIAGLALAGVPPLAGFWSKDAIIAATFASAQAWLFTPLVLLGTLLTGSYVGRALRLLWPKPESISREVNANKSAVSGWMLTGLVSLTGLATTSGLLVKPIGQLVGQEIPENGLALVLGLAVALVGLLVGWFELIGSFWQRLAQGNFRLDDWLKVLLVQPVLLLARVVSRADGWLHSGVLGVGRTGLNMARRVAGFDSRLHGAVVLTGRAGLDLARLSRQTDERGIDRLIAWMVRNIRLLGGRVRELPSGLVHQELLLTAAAVILLLGLILISR